MRSIADIFRSYGVVDADGRHVNGTDKETNHRYGDAYEQLFTIQDPKNDPGDIVRAKYPYSVRNDVRLMMEVGVADGSSLLAWREVFPNAKCVGLSIDAAPRVAESPDRIDFYLGDATQKDACVRAAADRQFDFIVDDATHRLEDVLRTLFWLWPYIRPGGLYVVEDGGFQDCARVCALFPFAEIVDTPGPFGGVEPLVVLRKPHA